RLGPVVAAVVRARPGLGASPQNAPRNVLDGDGRLSQGVQHAVRRGPRRRCDGALSRRGKEKGKTTTATAAAAAAAAAGVENEQQRYQQPSFATIHRPWRGLRTCGRRWIEGRALSGVVGGRRVWGKIHGRQRVAPRNSSLSADRPPRQQQSQQQRRHHHHHQRSRQHHRDRRGRAVIRNAERCSQQGRHSSSTDHGYPGRFEVPPQGLHRARRETTLHR
ncbi:unnamed protein product, partial [Ectocarpus sp. 4 AP-2014]